MDDDRPDDEDDDGGEDEREDGGEPHPSLVPIGEFAGAAHPTVSWSDSLVKPDGEGRDQGDAPAEQYHKLHTPPVKMRSLTTECIFE